MRDKRTLLLALLLLLLLWKLCFPLQMERLRARAEAALFPGARESAEAWGRSLAPEERVAARREAGGGVGRQKAVKL